MNQILFGFIFFLPAGVANVMPILVAKIPGLCALSYPIDGFQKISGARILGDHKTWRGLCSGVLAGTVSSLLLMVLIHQYQHIFSFIPQEYFYINAVLLGFLLSFGALFGDMVKSYFKRQFAISSGNSWFGFDQIDYVIGGICFSYLYLSLPLGMYGIIAVEWTGLHILFSFLGWLLKFKSQPI